eukprot:TRINITY_DN49624_c0_g1_i1.p1 TRINITY_DN49624_c0_g1~~TRINITY_DN49624_c0_g1_i1.p1  ORF type:complete len:474 (-),score=72.58 TRINITY_DN49624_c0_g1_i1:16-1437(-)
MLPYVSHQRLHCVVRVVAAVATPCAMASLEIPLAAVQWRQLPREPARFSTRSQAKVPLSVANCLSSRSAKLQSATSRLLPACLVAQALRSSREVWRQTRFRSRGQRSSSTHLACSARETGPRFPTQQDQLAKQDFAVDLAAYLQTGAVLPWEEAQALVIAAKKVLVAEQSLERVEVPSGSHVNIVGDVHGQFFDVLKIFQEYGLPSPENPYLFNGDFVDRGSFSVETLLLLLAWKVALPSHVRLARGNHEAHDMNVPYGFLGEVLTKYTPESYNLFQDVFANLPLAHVINNSVLIVHGGLPRDSGVRLDDIERLDRVAESSRGGEGSRESQLFTDLLWADPRSMPGRRPSERGGDCMTFGPDVTKSFLDANGLELLIRSHEVKDEGFEWQHEQRCLTVFSAPQYCDSCDNRGAVVRLHAEASGEIRPEVRVFDAAERPPFYVPAMAYSPMNPAARHYLSSDAKMMLSQLLGRG